MPSRAPESNPLATNPGADPDRFGDDATLGTPNRHPEMKRDAMRVDQIDRAILILRGHRVLLDSDLAALYGVEAKVLNQASAGMPSGFQRTSCSN
jgi:hypothetical protein